ncbi:hypothetical protein VDGL01_00067 [Verticillium dahliae]
MDEQGDLCARWTSRHGSFIPVMARCRYLVLSTDGAGVPELQLELELDHPDGSKSKSKSKSKQEQARASAARARALHCSSPAYPPSQRTAQAQAQTQVGKSPSISHRFCSHAVVTQPPALSHSLDPDLSPACSLPLPCLFPADQTLRYDIPFSPDPPPLPSVTELTPVHLTSPHLTSPRLLVPHPFRERHISSPTNISTAASSTAHGRRQPRRPASPPQPRRCCCCEGAAVPLSRDST